ncbi:MAG: hypothetical protein BWY76_02826 [bacterium ADurb.Bin429]|nr:MAG: hypothetical protein BWY76_02826 [bacterium ADurb.Bin429]
MPDIPAGAVNASFRVNTTLPAALWMRNDSTRASPARASTVIRAVQGAAVLMLSCEIVISPTASLRSARRKTG